MENKKTVIVGIDGGQYGALAFIDITGNLLKVIDMPFSIKTRTGTNEQDKQNQTEFLIKASEYADMITIHGRTTAQ